MNVIYLRSRFLPLPKLRSCVNVKMEHEVKANPLGLLPYFVSRMEFIKT